MTSCETKSCDRMERVLEWRRGEEPLSIRLPASITPVKVCCGRSHFALLTSK